MNAATAAELNQNANATQTGLRGRLVEVPSERAEATTRLLAAGGVLLHDDGDSRLELRADIAQQAPHATTVLLTHAHGRIELVLAAEHGSAAIGDRAWHDFSGDARLLAWTVAYESLIAQLSSLLGMPLLPVELLASPRTPTDSWHWVDFRFKAGETSRCEGLLGLDRATMQAMTAAQGWEDHRDSASRIRRGDVPLPCRLHLPAMLLLASELRKLVTDDVLVLGRRADVVSRMRLRADTGETAVDARYAWTAAPATDGITIIRALTETELRNETMSQESPLPEESAENSVGDILDAIPIRVEVLLDTLHLSLAELERMGAGQVLSLQQPLECAKVVLRANGKAFGSGELVALGELLGVKLTRIGDDRGLQ